MTTSLEPFGPDALQPAQEPCPHCPCCSVALCEKGRASVLECVGYTHADLVDAVTGCPCSAVTTEGTAAWRAGMVTATLQAVELPLPEPIEAVLRALASGESTVLDPHAFLLALRLRQFVRSRGELLAVTDLGRAYLAARDGRRVPARARVATVDTDANTARVLLDVCRPDQSVTVLLDQVENATGLEVYELPGVELDVIANVDAERVEEVVLTGIRMRTTPLPETWRADAAPDTPAAPDAPDASAAPDGKGDSGD